LNWRVIATFRNPAATDVEGEVHAMDVTDGNSVQALADKFVGEPIDLLLNNAGVYGPRDSEFGRIDYDAWDEVLRINALAPIRVAEAFKNHVLRPELKQMVFLSSMVGSIVQALVGDGFIYRSSKTCLNMAVNILANQLRSSGATCVLFHPGWVRTDMRGPSAAIEPTVSVGSMINAIKRLKPEDSGRFIDYDGFEFPW
jgi:NAD(P)-dependent dehydrogenase (short-subunit alcohol dehydrogenase family)